MELYLTTRSEWHKSLEENHKEHPAWHDINMLEVCGIRLPASDFRLPALL